MENVLVNASLLKKYSPIPLNFNVNEVANYAKISEEIWIEPVLGTNFYEHLLKQVAENKLTPEEQTLMLQILPYECFAIVLESLPFIAYHISEVGITKNKSDNSESVSPQELSYITQTLRADVEIRKESLLKWLKEYGGNFPEYYPDDCDCGCSCDSHGKLQKPNPYLQVYRPRKINTDLK